MSERRLLIVCPGFVPSNSPDMHRVRVSLAWYRKFGWHPTVLCVQARFIEAPREALFEAQLPADVEVVRTPAMALAAARRLGIGDVALRAYAAFRRAGDRLLRERSFDLVFFSTTAFTLMTLGPRWLRRYGVPFVLDFQDPWNNPRADHVSGGKHRLMRWLHRRNEARTVPQAAALMAVSSDYLSLMRRRYPELASTPSLVQPFAASQADFDLLETHPQANPVFDRADGLLHLVYVGRLGPPMARALRIVLRGLAQGLTTEPELFARMRLHLIGTQYASRVDQPTTAERLLNEFDLASQVHEHPARLAYFQSLQVMCEASALLVLGSEDRTYNPSKLFPSLLAQRPLLAVLHAKSQGVAAARNYSTWSQVLTFEGDADPEPQASAATLAATVAIGGGQLRDTRQWTAQEGTRSQCALFDEALPA